MIIEAFRLQQRGREPTMKPLSASMTAVVLAAATLAAAADMEFSPGDIIDWPRHSFAGETGYALIEVDGREAVHAICDDATASGLFYREEIDLEATPVVEWNWRVDATYADIDETSKAGDDYPARLYVVDEHSILRWRTRALNYVWASDHESGADWANAYASQARMVAVRDADDAGTGWHTERRNIREDFRRYHDRDLDRINAVAIMTDCDDTGQDAQAWYGEIRFLPE